MEVILEDSMILAGGVVVEGTLEGVCVLGKRYLIFCYG